MTGYTAGERARIRETLEATGSYRCPVCHVVLAVSRVEPRDDLAYVRQRVWVRCPACRRGATLDLPSTGHSPA